jgi:hypothetical protein
MSGPRSSALLLVALALLGPAAVVDGSATARGSGVNGGYAVSPPALGFTVPSAPPQPPAGVSVTASSDTALNIAWTPPLDDGGADLLAYKVCSTPATTPSSLARDRGGRCSFCVHDQHTLSKLCWI